MFAQEKYIYLPDPLKRKSKYVEVIGEEVCCEGGHVGVSGEDSVGWKQMIQCCDPLKEDAETKRRNILTENLWLSFDE